jgi:hypothetical protein
MKGGRLRWAIALVAAVVVIGVVAAASSREAVEHRIWIPRQHTTWQWQLTTPADLSVSAQLFDIDLFDNAASVVAALHRRGRKVLCYLDAGTYENFRPDRGAFPRWLLGKSNGWPGERWLDIRQLSALEPIMRERLARCANKGFDGVEADNVDGYANDTGFSITFAQQLAYNRWVARTAHELGLSIALKNDLGQVQALEPDFDYALDEQCFQYAECSALRPFLAAHKAVFEVEYNLPPSRFCARANAAGMMAMRKTLSLDRTRAACWS